MIRRFGLIIVTLALVGCGAQTTTPTTAPTLAPDAARASTPNAQAQQLLDGPVVALETALTANDAPRAKLAFAAFHSAWEQVEDGINAASPTAYDQIEAAMEPLKDELVRAATPDMAKASAAMVTLRQTLTAFATRQS